MNEVKLMVIVAAILAVLSYGIGRYAGRAPAVQTSTKVDQVDQTVAHQQETITETKKPDGTDTTVTTISTVKDETDKTDTQTQTKVTSQKPKMNVSLLAAASIHDPLGSPAYGLSVSKEFLGPMTLGLFGLTNGTLGVSVGINF